MKPTHAVIVQPKKVQSNDATLYDIKKSVTPKNIDVTIEGVRNISGGRIFINTSSAEEAKKLKSDAVRGVYQAALPNCEDPRW